MAETELGLALAQTPSAVAALGQVPLTASSGFGEALKSGRGSQPTSIPPASASSSLPMSAAWLVMPPPPAVDVCTIGGRRVRLAAAGSEEQPSLYRLCRQWVQNDTDLAAPVPEPVSASKLPPLPPLSEESAATLQRAAPQESPLLGVAEAEAGGSGSSGSKPPAVAALMQHHKQHWAAVRQHRRAQAAAAQQRYAQRLQTVLTLPNAAVGAVPAPLP
ncbi:hypothetical protein D9Q98_007536 [Chlorella vulgaris]|uniref:Uncharacterized protein n=1 Tax=Chlorella vulgaris TaxID=3077 RepID=A0A9D4YVL4_CHLVU|nr:hypothetical protein D9Q98_007536 [Chlorella vulgaris]